MVPVVFENSGRYPCGSLRIQCYRLSYNCLTGISGGIDLLAGGNNEQTCPGAEIWLERSLGRNSGTERF